MKDRHDEQEPDVIKSVDDAARAKRPYVPPQLVVFGNVSKLTQTGGISVKDMGGMKRPEA